MHRSKFATQPEECFWTEVVAIGNSGAKGPVEASVSEHQLPTAGRQLVLTLSSVKHHAALSATGTGLLSAGVIIPDAASWRIEELGIATEAFSHSGYNGPVSGFLRKILADLRAFQSGAAAERDRVALRCAELQQLLEAPPPPAEGAAGGSGDWMLTVVVTDPTGLVDVEPSGRALISSERRFQRTKEVRILLGFAASTDEAPLPNKKRNNKRAGGGGAAASDEDAPDPYDPWMDEPATSPTSPPLSSPDSGGCAFRRIVDAAADIPVFAYSCDVCRSRIIGQRYHCTECSDFDMCVPCFSRLGGLCTQGKHKLSHEKMSFGDMKRKLMATGGGLGFQTKLAFELFADRPCVGTTQTTLFGAQCFASGDAPAVASKYRYLTYAEVYSEAQSLAKALHKRVLFNAPLPATHDDHNCDPLRVAIFMKNSPEWVIVDVALTLLGLTSVPIDAGASPDTIGHILSVTDCHCVITHEHLREVLVPRLTPATRHLVVVPFCAAAGAATSDGGGDGEDIAAAASAQCRPTAGCPAAPPTTVTEHRVADLLRAGHKDPMRMSSAMPTRKPTDVHTLILTSGSTGRPKGAIQTHGIWAKCGFDKFLRLDPIVNVAYRPFSYATDRELIWRNLGNGGRVAIYTGSINALLDELVDVRPTTFSAPPRVWNGLFERFNADLRKAVKAEKEKALLKMIVDDDSSGGGDSKGPEAALDTRVRSLAFAVSVAENTARNRLLHQYSKIAGSRASLIGVGSAPVRPEVFEFLKECFEQWGSAQVYESFGTTESGGITLNGYVYSDCRVMLVDVPEMGFLTTNTPEQGEICVITGEGIPGYWKDPENTAKLFFVDDNGETWIRTGDIGEKRGGKLYIIDRRANLMKLASGVFMSPEHLEGVFLNCSSIKDCFVHAEAHWEFPLAVVSLSDSALAGDATGADETVNADAKRQRLEEVILAEFRAVAAEKGVPATNVPHGVIIASERFSVENSCLTISLKLSRPGLRKQFRAPLERLYDELVSMGPEMRTNSSAATLAVDGDGSFAMQRQSSSVVFEGQFRTNEAAVITAKLAKVYRRALHLRCVAVGLSAKQLGADSVSIAMLRERVAEATRVRVSVQVLWESSIEAVADVISKQREALFAADSCHRSSAKKPHSSACEDESSGGSSVGDLLRGSLKHDAVFAADEPLPYPSTPFDSSRVDQAVLAARRVVFLTGATGFIGAEILRCLAAKATSSSVIYCLVRGASADDAKGRLIAAFCRTNEDAAAQLESLLSAGAVRIVPGDLAAPLLGITTPELIFELQSAVTDVVHCGANVNHVLPYTALAEANVGSLRTLLKLFGAHRGDPPHQRPLGRCARFMFVSTISVAGLTQSHSVDAESRVVDALPDDVLERAGGYALSKWAAERLLLDAASKGVVRHCGNSDEFVGGFGPPPPPLAFVVRCGMTSWHSRLGYGNEADWLSRLFKAIQLLGVYPDAEPSAAAPTAREQTSKVGIMPVDWMAAAICAIVALMEADERSAHQLAPHGVAHLVSQRPFDLMEVVRALGARPVALQQWREALASFGGDVRDVSGPKVEATSATATKHARLIQSVAMLFPRGMPGDEDRHAPHDTTRLLHATAGSEQLLSQCTAEDMVRGGIAAYCRWLAAL